MSIIRGTANWSDVVPERAMPGGPAVGRVVRTLFSLVGIAAGIAYVAGRSRPHGASGDTQGLALSRLEARLARLEGSVDRSPVAPALEPAWQQAPSIATHDETRAGRLAHERRLAALERRLTAIERTRQARRSLLYVKPNGTTNGTTQEDRRHG